MGEGIATHLYAANVSMKNRAFYNTDGDFLILPQIGRLDVQTELGKYVQCSRAREGISHLSLPESWSSQENLSLYRKGSSLVLVCQTAVVEDVSTSSSYGSWIDTNCL